MKDIKQYTKKIKRIAQMEYLFDTVSEVVSSNPQCLHKNTIIQAMLDVLIDYYEHGQWLSDYESDEACELPADLKRGLLSQDGLYDLLYRINQIKY